MSQRVYYIVSKVTIPNEETHIVSSSCMNIIST